jgi:hypothetical protein
MEINNKVSAVLSLQNKKITYTIWFLILAITVLLSLICLNSKDYLRSTDALYYLSIADNYLTNGVFLDGTTVPNGPVLTPQNGIVWIFCLLRMLSFSNQQCILVVLGINYILLLGCIFPLIQICRRIGLETKELIFCVLFIFVGNSRIFTWLYMSPLNDMFFYAGQLWLLYLLILIDESLSGEREKTRLLNLRITTSIFLAAIIIHFRLNAIFIPIAGVLSAILLRKYRLIPLMLVLFIVMAVSVSTSYFIVDKYDFQVSTARIGCFWSDYKHQIYLLFFCLLPESLFRDLNQAGNLLYLPFYLSLLFAFIHGIRQKNILLLMLFFICCMTFMMTLLHGIVTERYLWVVTIFIYMMLFRIKGFRSFGFLFVAAVLINTIWSAGFDKNRHVVAWENISKEAVLKQENIIVITQEKRSCWYFTGIPAVFMDKYDWQQLLKAKTICVIGSQDYIDNHTNIIQELASANNHVVNIHYINYGKQHSDLLFCEVSLRGFTQAVEHVD